MPRSARVKSCEAIYHIMCRSISELPLFRDDQDKQHYLKLIKKYSDKSKCITWAYCLMNSHMHLQIDPCGYDISRFMHSLNTSYVIYYNKKYERHGHLFQGRFTSKIIDSDQYNLAVSAYIHNNPKDLKGFEGKEEQYPYSSYGIYLGLRRDTLGLVNKNFIMDLFDAKMLGNFTTRYYQFVRHTSDVGSLLDLTKTLPELPTNDYISGRRVIIRELPPSKIISYIADKLMIHNPASLLVKSKRGLVPFRAFTAYALRVLCNLSYKSICGNMCNITISGCSRLCDRGYELLQEGTLYECLLNELMSWDAA